jgi:6,7-dimethyl-8-ribityllumazine synthase
MTRILEGSLHAAGIRVALLVSRFHDDVTRRLLDGAERALDGHGGEPANRAVVWVPGSWELPLAASHLARSGRHDAVVALGTLVRGETRHFDLIAGEAARGLGEVALRTGVPVTFGVLTAESVEQAMERAGGRAGNKGWEAALSAVEMVNLLRRMA